MCCFLPLHRRNKGVIWSWLKLLTDNKNIFTSSPPILVVAFQNLYFLRLLQKPSKLNDKSFCHELKIFKRWKEIFGAVSAQALQLRFRRDFLFAEKRILLQNKNLYFHFICKVAFKKPAKLRISHLMAFQQWCQELLHYICTLRLTYQTDISIWMFVQDCWN